MKRLLMSAIAASALTAAALPAAAQSWTPINQRQAQLEAQINQGVRSGALTAPEAVQLRGEFRQIVNLEARYRASAGLQANERADLDTRLNVLRARIFLNKTDAQYVRAWQPINARQAALVARIEGGVRGGGLTRAEANMLMTEFRNIAALEANYRRSGGFLSIGERRDLDARLFRLSQRIYAQRNDGQVQGGGAAWLSINQRQASLFARIQQGVQNGALTAAEANQLRAEYNGIAAMEATYRRSGGGLTAGERADLDRRMDTLSRRVFVNKNDRQTRR